MKNMFLLFLLFLFSLSINSQDLFDEYSDYYAPFKKKHVVELEHLKKFGFSDIYKYNSEDFITHKDSSHILSKIKYVAIELHANKNLDSVFTNLSLLSNLKFISLNNNPFLKEPEKSIVFSLQLLKLKKLETIVFYGSFYGDWNAIFEQLSNLSTLKNLALISPKIDILLTPNFKLLKNIEGIYYSGRISPKIPVEIGDFPFLKSVIISSDEDKDFNNNLRNLVNNSNLENLIISDLNINDSIAETLSNFKSLKKLNLNNSKIENSTHFFKLLGKRTKLKVLKIYNNNINNIPNEIGLLDSLEIFSSSSNIKTKTLPDEFYSLTNLKQIEIQGSELEEIDIKINNLKKLENLTLFYNKIHTMPINMGNLKEVEKILIQHNKIESLPLDIGLLKNLTHLNISDNKIHELPHSFIELKKLDTLYLQNNFLTKLPYQIGNLNNLRYLNISKNLISKFPKSITKLKELQFLNAETNDIKLLPKKFGKLTSLEILELNSNFIKELPNSFGNLYSLKRLRLAHNNINRLPKTFGRLTSLENFSITNKENHKARFESYNHVFGGFKKDSINRLERKTNNLTNLPSNFYRLKNLLFIDLSDNKNLNVDNLFDQLKKSESKDYYLDISNCSIKELPENGWYAIKVKSLDISNNQISKLPFDLKNCLYLNSLNLNKNLKFNTSRSNIAQINLLLEEEGLIEENELPKTTEMAIALADVSNKKYYSNEYKKSVEYADRAIAINKDVALIKICDDCFVKSLYLLKDYNRVIYYADIAIKKDTSRNIRFLNSIIPNFTYKAKSHLALGDTIKAIENFVILSSKFNGNSWTEAGMLARKINLKNDAKKYFNKSFDFYKNYLEKNKTDWGYHISLLEAFIISEEKTLAQDYYNKLSLIDINDRNYKLLLNYFGIINDIVYNQTYIKFSDDFIKLNESLIKEKIELKSWSFELFLDWNKINKLTDLQKEQIIKLTNLFL